MSQRGHIRQRGKSFTAYWFVRNEDGKRVQRSKGGFRTKREATAHLNVVLGEVQAGTYTEPVKITVARFLRDEWLPSLTQRPSTQASYRDLIEAYVVPRIGGDMLPALTPAKLQALYTELATSGRHRREGGLSPRTVQYVATVLRMALEYAVAHGFIPRNPAAVVRRPRAQTREMTAWTAAEAGEFLKAVECDRLYCAWLLFLTRGPRRGELAGLRWSDVDLDGGRISIVHTRVSVEGQAVTSTPKTSRGRRTVPLDDRLTAALKAHRLRQREDRMAWAGTWEDTGYVFTRQDGKPYHPEFFTKTFDRVVARARLRRIRLHDTRHTAASLALQAGIPAKVVSEWLGHSSVSITLDTYSHVIPSMSEDAGARLTALILGDV